MIKGVIAIWENKGTTSSDWMNRRYVKGRCVKEIQKRLAHTRLIGKPYWEARSKLCGVLIVLGNEVGHS